MRLLEFQTKRLFRERGIPVPDGVLVSTREDLASLRYPVVLKPQVLAGGRGRAGAIRTAGRLTEAAPALQELLGVQVKGHAVRAVLAEQYLEVEQELYLSLQIDRESPSFLLLASASGGIGIEDAARTDPARVLRVQIDPSGGPMEEKTRDLAGRLGVARLARDLSPLLARLFALFRELDASLVEVNPLAATAAGFVVLDARLVLDDRARFRHTDLFEALTAEQAALTPDAASESERLAEAAGLAYVPLDGSVAVISDGAGTGMLTLDFLHDAGARAAGFCDLGGVADPAGMRAALGVVLANPQARVILLSLIGGLTRMDEMAEGVLAFAAESGLPRRLVVRMAGTKECEGRALLRSAGIEAFADLAAAVREAVRLAKEAEWRSS